MEVWLDGRKVYSLLLQASVNYKLIIVSGSRSSCNYEYMGFHQLFWSISNILHNGTKSFSIGYCLGWQHPGLPSLLHRHFYWTTYRCGVFQSCLHLWISLSCIWSFYDFLVDHVLATIPCSGRMLWIRERVFVLSCTLHSFNIFHQEKEFSYWNMCCRISNRWNVISWIGEGHASNCRICLDNENSWLLPVSQFGSMLHWYQAEDKTEESWRSG